MNDDRLNQYRANAADKQKAIELRQKNLGQAATRQGVSQTHDNPTFGEEEAKTGLASNRNNNLPGSPEQSNEACDSQTKNDPRIEEMVKRREDMDKRSEEIDGRKEGYRDDPFEPERQEINEDIQEFNADVDDFNRDLDELKDDHDR